MDLNNLYNSIGKGINNIGQGISDAVNYVPSKLLAEHYIRPDEPVQQNYNIPPVIPQKHRQVFIDEARKAGVTPDEFGQIASREQGSTTIPLQAKLTGTVDPTDRGVMQVNKLNEPLIQQKFQVEFGRNYNPNNAVDSIMAARIMLQENRRQFEQMKANKTYTEPYSNQDLIDSYNTGVGGFVKAKQGNKEKQDRLMRYQQAGTQ